MLLKGKRVFYVEDDLNNRAIVQMMLEREGASMSFERWGRADTVTRLTAFMPVDLILLDLMFPQGVTGYDVYDAIRTHSEFDAIPIIAISASDASVEIPKVRARGFTGYISKPINFRMFPSQILAILNGQPVWHAD
ncbi:MAG: response regulator [Armatimonadetes bacterium]|nr:response regulator [Anaerolineae bacterium]